MRVKPATIFQVLWPVSRMMPSARRLSSPWWTMATASIREPMMKKTASFMKAEATSLAGLMLNTTCIKMISMATAGNGRGSVMIRTRAIQRMVMVLKPASLRPVGTGTNQNMTTPSRIAARNQRFCRIQNNRDTERFDKPASKASSLRPALDYTT